MGMDVYGIEPREEKGEYFGANVWCWRPLWEYVCEVCDIDEETRHSGQFNDGREIDNEQAVYIGTTLHSLIKMGAVKEYAETYKSESDALPDVECTHCSGTGQRDDEHVQGECNGCHGKGTVRPFETHYPFVEESVEEFAQFAKLSGGFEIC